MKEFLEYLIKQIVDTPDEVSVTVMDQEGFVVLTLTVAQTDMGKVIGKGGRIIKAVRDLVRILAVKTNQRVNVVLAQS